MISRISLMARFTLKNRATECPNFVFIICLSVR